MMHVTQGRIDRYEKTAIMLKGQKAFDEWYLHWMKTTPYIGRRAWLKALRDFMSPRLNHDQRSFWRQRPSLKTQRLGRESWMVPADQYRAQLRASGKSEAFNEFMARKLGIEVAP